MGDLNKENYLQPITNDKLQMRQCILESYAITSKIKNKTTFPSYIYNYSPTY